jgi:DNA polymerase-3 subunit delta
MYKQEFDNNIKKGYFFKSIMLYGEEEFFIIEYTKKILAILNITSDEKMTIYQDEYHADTCLNYLSQSSLFGDRNILILKLYNNKIDKKHIQKLIDATTKNENSYFVLQLFDTNFKSYSTLFSKKNNLNHINHVRFFKPYVPEALNILQDKANKLKININKSELKHIYEHQNMNISFAVNDLEKLSIFDEQIDIKMINSILFNLSTVTQEQIIDKILAKHDFSEDLQNFLKHANSKDSSSIISYFANHIITLIEYHSFIKVNSYADSKAILGFAPPKHIEQKYISQAMRYSLRDFEIILNYLLSLDLELKKGLKIDKEPIIFTSLLELKRIISKE